MTESLGIQSRPPQLAELEEGQSVTVLAQPKTLGGGAPLASQYREYKRVGGKLLSWETKDMLAEVDWSTTLPDTLAITNIPAGASDYDKFLVSDGGMIKYRTGAQMLSDLGVATADHTHALPDLTDVVITGPANLDVLQYNGSNWVDLSLAEAGISATGHLHDDRYYTETEIDAMPLVDYAGTPTAGHIPYFTDADTITFDDGNLFWDAPNNRLGIGTNAPDSIFHIKANVAGTVGSHPAGQLIIQDPDDTVFGNAVITGYESDGAGNPDQQLWYLGSSSSGNSNIIFLNRRNSKLQLGTNGVSRLTISGSGKVGIGTALPNYQLSISDGTYEMGFEQVGSVPIWYNKTGNAFRVQTDVDNTSTFFDIRGKGTGSSYFRLYNAGHTGYLETNIIGANTYITGQGTANGQLFYQAGAQGDVSYFYYSPSGKTNQLRIGGYRTGDALRHLEIGVGVDAADTASFDGVSNYYFDGSVGIGTTTVPYLLTLKNEGQMGDVSFSSGWAGNDWALTYAAGLATLQLDDLFVRGSLTVYELIINQINAVNGAMIISPARGKVASVSGSPSTEVVTMEDPEGNGYTTFAANDIVLIQRVDLNAAYTIVKRIVRKVASAAGAAVTMSAAAGAPADTGSIAAGDVVVVIGNVNTTTRDASIYMTSTDSNNPYIQVMDGVTSWADWTDVNKIKCVLGNLNGKYGYAAEIYGFAAGDKTNEYVTIDPTNGFRILDGGQGDAVMLQASASQLSVGTGFVYTTADTTLKVAGWVTTTTSMMHNYETDHELRLRLDSPNESIYFWDGTPANNAVRWLGLGKLHNGTDFTSDEGIGMVVYNGATYDKMFWLSQNEKSIAGWQITKDTLEKLTANVGVKLDATNTKIQVGDLDEQHIDLLGADGTIKWYKSDGAGGDTLVITIDDSVYLGEPGIKILGSSYKTTVIPIGVYIAHPSSGALYATLTGSADGGYLALSDEASAFFFRVFQSTADTKIYASALESATGTDLIIDSGSYIKKKSSSRRYKENIRPLGIDSSIIYKASPSTFEWRVNNLTDHGLIAEDLSDLHQDLAFYNSEGKAESVNQGALMALTIAELKKLRTDVDGLIAAQEAN